MNLDRYPDAAAMMGTLLAIMAGTGHPVVRSRSGHERRLSDRRGGGKSASRWRCTLLG